MKSDYSLRHVCPSVCPAPTRRIFIKFDTSIIFRKAVEEIQVPLKSDNNNGTLHEDRCTFLVISRSIILRMRNVSNKSYRENQNTHFVCSPFFFENRAVYEIMWKNAVDRGKPPDNTAQARCSWIPRATNRHTKYVIIAAFPLQQWLQERAPFLRYTYTSCLVSWYLHFHTTVDIRLYSLPTWKKLTEFFVILISLVLLCDFKATAAIDVFVSEMVQTMQNHNLL
jgi:hypothetical protein